PCIWVSSKPPCATDLVEVRALQYKETARASPPLLLPEDTDGNVPGFGGDEANLFLVVVNHEIVVDDRAVRSRTHERAGAFCIYAIGVRSEFALRDLAVSAHIFHFGTIVRPLCGEHTHHGDRSDPDESPPAAEPIGAFDAGV